MSDITWWSSRAFPHENGSTAGSKIGSVTTKLQYKTFKINFDSIGTRLRIFQFLEFGLVGQVGMTMISLNSGRSFNGKTSLGCWLPVHEL